MFQLTAVDLVVTLAIAIGAAFLVDYLFHRKVNHYTVHVIHPEPVNLQDSYHGPAGERHLLRAQVNPRENGVYQQIGARLYPLELTPNWQKRVVTIINPETKEFYFYDRKFIQM